MTEIQMDDYWYWSLLLKVMNLVKKKNYVI